MKKIKLLYTINFLTNGGPTRVLLNQIKCLDLNTYDVSVLTIIDSNDRQIVENLMKKNIHVVEYKMDKSIKGLLHNFKKIIQLINEINPDIIHTHGIVTSLAVASKKIKCKKITTIHNNMFEDYKYTYGSIKGIIIADIHIHQLKKFDQVICCSKTSYEVLKNRIKNISYIRNGIDVDYPKNDKTIRSQIRNELKIPMDATVFIYCGVITNRKQVVELVQLFNQALDNNEYLLIVGDGPLYKEALAVCVNDHIKFLGFQKNVMDYYIAADIYTSYSSSEGFSISIIEALSCGLLLFVSDIASHKECFEIDDKYYIGETFTDKDFMQKKEKLINKVNNKTEIKEFYQKNLSALAMSKQYEEYYLYLGSVKDEKN